MSQCVVVTRAGAGDLWLFPDVHTAERHPLRQFGDAMFSNVWEAFDEFRIRELPALLMRVGKDGISATVSSRIDEMTAQGKTDRLIRDALISTMDLEIWNALVSAASEPPTDPAVVFELVQSDRDKGVKSRNTTMAAKKEAAVKEAKAPKAPKEVKEKVYGANKHKASAVITLGKDKEGKDYGPKNNPKREGSASAVRFALYKNGMTIQKALDAGVSSGDINFDSDAKRGFITIAG